MISHTLNLNVSRLYLPLNGPVSARPSTTRSWQLFPEGTSPQQRLKCIGRVSCCLSSDNSRYESTRKVSEDASVKNSIFPKWTKEIERNEEARDVVDCCNGSWIGWGARFRGFDNDHFWQCAMNIGLMTILGFICLVLCCHGLQHFMAPRKKPQPLLTAIVNPLLNLLKPKQKPQSLLAGIFNPLLNLVIPRRKPQPLLAVILNSSSVSA